MTRPRLQSPTPVAVPTHTTDISWTDDRQSVTDAMPAGHGKIVGFCNVAGIVVCGADTSVDLGEQQWKRIHRGESKGHIAGNARPGAVTLRYDESEVSAPRELSGRCDRGLPLSLSHRSPPSWMPRALLLFAALRLLFQSSCKLRIGLNSLPARFFSRHRAPLT
jgi:hypothetical protein